VRGIHILSGGCEALAASVIQEAGLVRRGLVCPIVTNIHVVPTPAQFPPPSGKFGNVDWREDCSRCTNCVKLRCLYDVYRHEAAYNRDPLAPVETSDECKACSPACRLHQRTAWASR